MHLQLTNKIKNARKKKTTPPPPSHPMTHSTPSMASPKRSSTSSSTTSATTTHLTEEISSGLRGRPRPGQIWAITAAASSVGCEADLANPDLGDRRGPRVRRLRRVQHVDLDQAGAIRGQARQRQVSEEPGPGEIHGSVGGVPGPRERGRHPVVDARAKRQTEPRNEGVTARDRREEVGRDGPEDLRRRDSAEWKDLQARENDLQARGLSSPRWSRSPSKGPA